MCGESGGYVWRDEKEFTSGQTIHHHKYHVLSAFATFAAFAAFATFAHSTLSEKDKKKTHEALRGATGSGNVTLGQSASGTTSVNSLTTRIGNTGASSVYIGSTAGSNHLTSQNNYIGVTGLGSTWIASQSFALVPSLTLGAAPGYVAAPGATGTFASNTLGYGIRINNLSLTISNYNQNNSVASIQTAVDGVYLATWSIQVQITTPPTDLSSNLAINTVSVTSVANQLGFSNWGYSKINSIVYTLSGSVVAQITAGSFCNVTMNMAGSAGVSAPAVTYCLTRIG